jgi:hypothetical protein
LLRPFAVCCATDLLFDLREGAASVHVLLPIALHHDGANSSFSEIRCLGFFAIEFHARSAALCVNRVALMNGQRGQNFA